MRRCFRGGVCTCSVLVLCCVELEFVNADKVLFFDTSVHVRVTVAAIMSRP